MCCLLDINRLSSILPVRLVNLNKNTLRFDLLGQTSLNMTVSYQRNRIKLNTLLDKKRRRKQCFLLQKFGDKNRVKIRQSKTPQR